MSLNSVELIKRSFTFAKDNIIPLFAIGVVLMAPVEFVMSSVEVLLGQANWLLGALVGIFGMFISVIAAFLMQAAIVTTVLERSADGTVHLERALARTMKRLIPMVITSLLCGLAISVGLMFFIVPGIILAIGLFAAIPMVIAEDIDPMDAIRGSWELTKGHKMDIFVTGLLMFLFMIPVAIVVGLVSMTVGKILSIVFVPAVMVAVLTGTVFSAVLNIPGQVLTAILYEELRGMAAAPPMMAHAPGYAPPQQQYGQAASAPPMSAPPMGAPPMGAPPTGPPAA
ncbi:MAG: hypothetical protein ACI81R_001390 [Bradymonadia bacterium]|jgi:hypothetical protein